MGKEIIVRLPETSAEISISEEWIEKRDELLAESQTIEAVKDSDSYETAGEILKRITKTSNSFEKLRKDFDKPFRQASKLIKQAADQAKEPLEEEKKRIQSVLSEYAEAERRRREAEEQRIEEERQRRLQEQAEQAEAEEELFGESTTEIVEPEPELPETQKPKSDATRTVERLEFEVSDPEAVPGAFKTVDERKIRAWLAENKQRVTPEVKAGEQPIPGVRCEIKTQIIAR